MKKYQKPEIKKNEQKVEGSTPSCTCSGCTTHLPY